MNEIQVKCLPNKYLHIFVTIGNPSLSASLVLLLVLKTLLFLH